MPLERTSQTYGPGVTAASRSVLLELITLLRAYRDALVLVGGWVPYLLLEHHRRPQDRFVHVGSIDIDLAVDPATVNEPRYATIVELLRGRGYRPILGRRQDGLPCAFERIVQSPLTNKSYTIRVDFLTPFGDQGRKPVLPVQDELVARKIKGCELAFRHHMTVNLTGALPDGGELTVPLRMADVVGCLAMKGIVLGERYREKDAYDIYAVIAHYQRGPRDVADTVRPHLEDGLVREGLTGIQRAFATRRANGPAWAAAFLVHAMFGQERERVTTDAFMMVSEFTRLVFASEAAGSRA